MNFISSLIIILIFVGIFVLMYVIGGVMDALERYIRSRGKKNAEQKSNSVKEV